MSKYTANDLKQAVEEAAIVFAVTFAMAMGSWMSGLGALPNMQAGAAAAKSATIAGVVAAGKAVVWFFTGTRR